MFNGFYERIGKDFVVKLKSVSQAYFLISVYFKVSTASTSCKNKNKEKLQSEIIFLLFCEKYTFSYTNKNKFTTVETNRGSTYL